VPFIARYRKEATGTLDEVAVEAIREGLERLRELDKRRAVIRASLEERGLLGEELQHVVGQCPSGPFHQFQGGHAAVDHVDSLAAVTPTGVMELGQKARMETARPSVYERPKIFESTQRTAGYKGV